MAKAKAKAAAKAKAKTSKATAQTLEFNVSIQKIFEKMKAIVDDGKEAEFLAKCQTLKDHRFLTVNARTVKTVKDFLVEHELGDSGAGAVAKSAITPTAVAPAPVAVAGRATVAADETCFKK